MNLVKLVLVLRAVVRWAVILNKLLELLDYLPDISHLPCCLVDEFLIFL